MFWGLVLEPGKRYSTVVEKSFYISKAALDCASVKKDNEFHTVIVETEDQENILCTLSKEKGILQETLDLKFVTGDNITFECKGSGTVHMTGYLDPDDFGLGDEELEEEFERADESEESESEVVPSTQQQLKKLQAKSEKRKADVPPPLQNKKKKTVEPEESDLESDDESDEDAEMESDLSDDEDEDESNEDEAESDEEDSEEDQLVSPQLTKQQKKQQQNQKKNTSPQKQQLTPGKQNKGIVNGLSTKLSGKKDKKKGQTPQPQTPGQNATPKAKTPNANEEGTPKKRVVEAGVTIKDLKVGNGQAAKPGKMVQVYYTGRLKSNNKVFDSVNKGEGFKFRLGKGEVIKGWDIGLNGMKVGGKRTITCPANVAYGSSGSPPTIPPNSTLIFDVELKGTN